MNSMKKVLVFGAAGRVGLELVKALLPQSLDICAVDFIEQKRLTEILSRLEIDARLSLREVKRDEVEGGKMKGQVSIYGNFDVLNEDKVVELLAHEQPDIVVNYAIPFTWDAAKQLPNYKEISRAGLGAFAAVQVLAPKTIARALAITELDTKLIVGNLPDITIPIIYGLNHHENLQLPVAGAGNVGLIEAAIKYQVAKQYQVSHVEIEVFLVAHHVHWVVPREPGYRDDAPFLLKVSIGGKDISEELGCLRELMNNAIADCYEAGAGFSSTTALLAAQLVLSLLDNEKERRLHVPAPNGLPGGYPVKVNDGNIKLNLPKEWDISEATRLMKKAHQRDGIEKIDDDGCIHFLPESVEILRKEIGIQLPQTLKPVDLGDVAREQIRVARKAIR